MSSNDNIVSLYEPRDLFFSRDDEIEKSDSINLSDFSMMCNVSQIIIASSSSFLLPENIF